MNPYYNGYGNFGANPYLNTSFANNRLTALEQQFNQQPQQMQSQFSSVRPVTSIEEVKGITPNFDGSKMWFEDATNKKLYSKYIDINGLPHIDSYTLTIEEKNQSEGYCTKEEYNALKEELDNYKGILDNLLTQLGGAKNE